MSELKFLHWVYIFWWAIGPMMAIHSSTLSMAPGTRSQVIELPVSCGGPPIILVFAPPPHALSQKSTLNPKPKQILAAA